MTDYLDTRARYLAGGLHSATAIGELTRDRTLIAEAELRGLAPLDAARSVVRGPWARRLVTGDTGHGGPLHYDL